MLLTHHQLSIIDDEYWEQSGAEASKYEVKKFVSEEQSAYDTAQRKNHENNA